MLKYYVLDIKIKNVAFLMNFILKYILNSIVI